MDSGLENIRPENIRHTMKDNHDNIVTVMAEDEHEYSTTKDTEEEPGHRMTEETLETDIQTTNENENRTKKLIEIKPTNLPLNKHTESISSKLSIITEKTEHTTRRNVNTIIFNSTTHDSIEVLKSDTNGILKTDVKMYTTTYNTITEAAADYNTTERETEHDLTVSQAEYVVDEITTENSFNFKIETNGTQNVAESNKIEHVKENEANLNIRQTDLDSNAFTKVNKTRIK